MGGKKYIKHKKQTNNLTPFLREKIKSELEL